MERARGNSKCKASGAGAGSARLTQKTRCDQRGRVSKQREVENDIRGIVKVKSGRAPQAPRRGLFMRGGQRTVGSSAVPRADLLNKKTEFDGSSKL